MRIGNPYLAILGCIIITLFVFSSCRKGGKCEHAPNVNQSEVVVVFKDKQTGKYLYTEVSPLYNIDSLKIYDENNNRLIILYDLDLIPNTSSRYWGISFGNIYNSQTDQGSFNSEICRNFIVKYKYNETDTIKTCFNSRRTRCGSVFETLKVYHRGLLVGSGSNTTGFSVTINKE